MTAALPMGGQKITGMAEPTVSTDAATKNYVDTTTAAFFSTGDCKLTIKTVVDSGWIMATSTTGHVTIGNAGATATYAFSYLQALYALIWNNFSNADAPVTSGRGASAAADWAGLKAIQVGYFAGRAVGLAGNPPDLATNRLLGSHLGAETFTLGNGHIPTLVSTNAAQALSVTSSLSTYASGNQRGDLLVNGSGGYVTAGSLSNLAIGSITSTANNSITTTFTNASPTAVSLYQPTVFLNIMMKY